MFHDPVMERDHMSETSVFNSTLKWAIAQKDFSTGLV
jgi:hypothetical protein